MIPSGKKMKTQMMSLKKKIWKNCLTVMILKIHSEDEEDDDEEEDDEDDDDEEDDDDDDEDSTDDEKDTKKKRKYKNMTKKPIKKSHKKGTSNKDTKKASDTRKIKEYLRNRDQKSYNSTKALVSSFEKLTKDQRKKILDQISKANKHTSCPLVYQIMLSQLPQIAKNDIVSRLESLDKNEDECPKYREYVNAH